MQNEAYHFITMDNDINIYMDNDMNIYMDNGINITINYTDLQNLFMTFFPLWLISSCRF